MDMLVDHSVVDLSPCFIPFFAFRQMQPAEVYRKGQFNQRCRWPSRTQIKPEAID